MQVQTQKRAEAAPTATEQGQPARLGRMIRQFSRGIAIPAFAAMVGGLLLHYATQRGEAGMPGLLGPAAVPLNLLTTPAALFSGLGAMSVGVLALASLPALTVLFILIQGARKRQWSEVLPAAGVLAVLGLSLILGH